MLTTHRSRLATTALLLLPLGWGCGRADRTSSQVCSDGGFCWQRPVPQGNSLHSISGVSSRYIWAVGDRGTILHYDGKSWRSVASGTTHNLHGVYCLGQHDAWAVGDEGTALRYDGEHWNKIDRKSVV